MSEAKILHFPQPNPKPDNDPYGADYARARIAALPDAYAAAAAPKDRLAHKAAPHSPAAERQPLKANLPAWSEIGPKLRPAASEAAAETKWQEPDRTVRRPVRGHLKPLITAAVTFGLVFMLFKAPIFLTQLSYAVQKPAAVPATDNNTAAVGPDPVLDIPKINVRAPVVFAASNAEADIQKDLEGGVVHYANTALPGTRGNSVIFGHSSNDWWEPGNYKFVFVLLDKLVVGDTYTVNYNSRQYLYRVEEVKVVDPTDLSVLGQTPDAQMTLITCTPPGTSWKRLIVRAKQVSPAPEPAQPLSAEQPKPGILPSNAPSVVDGLGRLWNSVVNLLKGQP